MLIWTGIPAFGCKSVKTAIGSRLGNFKDHVANYKQKRKKQFLSAASFPQSLNTRERKETIVEHFTEHIWPASQ